MMAQYSNVPMDLADAYLMRMAELHPGASVFTLDSDFYVYRTAVGAAPEVIAPR